MLRDFPQTIVRIGLGCLLSLGLAGCHIWPVMSDADGRKPFALGKSDQVMSPYAPHPVHLSENFGDAFRTARDNQILHPEASGNLEPVTGVDGPATATAIERYRKHFQKPPFEVKVKERTGGSKK